MKHKYVVYDIEIKKAILKRGDTALPDIEYCDGFHDHKNMGISCICARTDDGKKHAFMDEVSGYEGFQDLVNYSELIVTFNGINFDNKVCATNGIEIPDRNYDILREIWIAVGANPDTYHHDSHGGYGLDAMCNANNFGGKSGNGADAPIWYQRGQWRELLSYCHDDVILTDSLFDQAMSGISLTNPKMGAPIKLRQPVF